MAGATDLCDYHDYDDPTHAIPDDGYNRLAQRIQQCQALSKPLFIGESGIPADVTDNGGESGAITAASLQLRAGFFAAKMAAAFNAGVVGYGLWDKEQDASDGPWNVNDDQKFDIGPNSAEYDPTNAAVATMATTLGQYAGTVQANFEDGGTDGWSVAPGSTGASVANSTAEARDGTHALALTIAPGVSQAALVTPAVGTAAPGSTMTMHVYEPSGAPTGLTAAPFVVDQTAGQTLGTAVGLVPGWNLITWTIPATVSAPVGSIGLQLADAPQWAGTLYLDGVAWGAPSSTLVGNSVSAAAGVHGTASTDHRTVRPRRRAHTRRARRRLARRRLARRA
jgi:hypothetical protein